MADVLAFTTIVAIVVVGARIWSKARRTRRSETWLAAARRLGLDFDGEVITGRMNGVAVAVDIHTTGSGDDVTTFTRFRMGVNAVHGVELGREHFLSRFSQDIQIGDVEFDRVVRVKGDETMALALLDAKTRGLVKGAVSAGWTMDANGWQLLGAANLNAEIAGHIEQGVKLAVQTSEAALSAPDRLLELVESDPLAAVRKKALSHLVQRYASSQQRKQAVAAALKDREPEIRLVVALAAKNDPVLLALACDVKVAGELRVRALTALLRGTYREDPKLVAAVERLVAEVVDSGAAVDPELVAVIAEALGVVPIARAESVLVALLEWKEDAVKIAAVNALAKVGSVESVRVLMPLRDRFVVFANALVVAARDAILAIQARAGNSEAGALAIAEAESGLAVVDEG